MDDEPRAKHKEQVHAYRQEEERMTQLELASISGFNELHRLLNRKESTTAEVSCKLCTQVGKMRRAAAVDSHAVKWSSPGHVQKISFWKR